MGNKWRLPIMPYETGRYLRFGQKIRRRGLLWATHLGDDVVASPGTPVAVIGQGEVVWSEVRPGSHMKPNWGGIVIVRHHNFQTFYSVYGHMKNLSVKKGERVIGGQKLGVVAEGNTPENGWWQTPHLHFAIYTGPWRDRVLPGYARPDDWLRVSPRRTRRQWWHNPQEFIRQCT